ncbi:hypothetical protein BASA81_000573 [Batrachochytrium salamandrivorans]|nr:hypothetical protein BASA81_000573 [Batrachochytrium salamandrivorans]
MGLCASSPSSSDQRAQMRRPTSPKLMSGRDSKLSSSDLKFKYVIVGFGMAGGAAAGELARLGVGEFEVALVGEEPSFAYQRPVLSKSYLFPPNLPGKPPARLPGFTLTNESSKEVQDEDWYQTRHWTCYLNTKCVGMDFKSKTIKLISNQTDLEERITYEHLIVATGSRPTKIKALGLDLVKHGIYHLYKEEDFSLLVRKLERVTGKRFVNRKLMTQKKGGKSNGVLQSSRKLDDVEKRSQIFQSADEDGGEDGVGASRAVVLGGGPLGVEVACALSGWGLDEILLITSSQGLFPAQTKWSCEFRERVVREIESRCKLRVVVDDTVSRVVGLDPNQPSPLREVVLGKSGEVVSTEILVVAVGSTPNKDLFMSGSAVKMDVDGKTFKLNNAKNVWVAGELAVPNCGAERSKELGRSAARAAFHSSHSPPSSTVPCLASSTMFDFTDNPLTWYEIAAAFWWGLLQRAPTVKCWTDCAIC